MKNCIKEKRKKKEPKSGIIKMMDYFLLTNTFLFSIKEKRIIKKPVKIWEAHDQSSVVVDQVVIFSSSQ